MSRNCAGGTDCQRCGGPVIHDESDRPITKEETGANYWDEYQGMLVANAHCRDCGAKYLAWVRTPEKWSSMGHLSPSNYEPGKHVDLSYRSTFNDEPGPSDLPPWDDTARSVRDLAMALQKAINPGSDYLTPWKEIARAIVGWKGRMGRLLDLLLQAEPHHRREADGPRRPTRQGTGRR